MKYLYSTMFAVVMLFAVSYQPVNAQSVSTDQNRAALLQQIDSLLQLIATLQAQLEVRLAEQQEEVSDDAEKQEAEESEEDDQTEAELPESPIDGLGEDIDLSKKHRGFDGEYDVKYAVRSNGDIDAYSGSSDKAHQRVWEMFLEIAGHDLVTEKVDRFFVFDSEESGSAAFMTAEGGREPNWSLSVNMDAFGNIDENLEFVVETLTHEYVHLLSLNGDHVNFGNDWYGCVAFVEVGCARSGSYVREYVVRFWDDVDHGRSSDLARIDRYDHFINELNDQYEDLSDEFVSAYALVDPAEDFAESFSYYIFDGEAPEGSEFEEKMEFFDEYPVLVEEKVRIRNVVWDMF